MERWSFILLATVAVAHLEWSVAAFQGIYRAPLMSGHRHNYQSMGGWTSPILLSARNALRLRSAGRFKFGNLRTVATASATVSAMPLEKFRKDYKAPDYSIRSVDLTFKIFPGHTQVDIIHICDFTYT